jgi:hypothetical protein
LQWAAAALEWEVVSAETDERTNKQKRETLKREENAPLLRPIYSWLMLFILVILFNFFLRKIKRKNEPRLEKSMTFS